MVRPTRASYIGISQQWRASFGDGNSVTPAQVISITVEDELPIHGGIDVMGVLRRQGQQEVVLGSPIVTGLSRETLA